MNYPLPLEGIVAFAGSRYGSPFGVPAAVGAVLAAGGSLRVGCVRGVDQCVRTLVPNPHLVVVSTSDSEFSHLPVKAALVMRTRAIVKNAHCLLAFPAASGLGKGTNLAINTALELVLPIWVAGFNSPTGKGWTPHFLFNVSGWLYIPCQTRLFNI